MTPIVELGVAEAYEILEKRLGHDNLPPLEAIENEDWGRDYLLSQLQALDLQSLTALGLTRDDGPRS